MIHDTVILRWSILATTGAILGAASTHGLRRYGLGAVAAIGGILIATAAKAAHEEHRGTPPPWNCANPDR